MWSVARLALSVIVNIVAVVAQVVTILARYSNNGKRSVEIVRTSLSLRNLRE